MTITTDPRLGLPSASKFERIVLCPGSKQLEKTLPEAARNAADTPDEDALRGTKIHKARETGQTLDLEPEELATYDKGVEFEGALTQQWISDNAIRAEKNLFYEGPREERLWLNHPQTFDPLCSGQLDVHYIAKPHALIVDWKAGFAKHVAPARSNWQVRLQAVLLWREHDGIGKIRVAINRCMAYRGANDYCDYTEHDLEESERSILYHLWQAEQPDAIRHAGDHCTYCPCKEFCPEAGALALLPTVIARQALPFVDAEEIGQMVDAMAPADLKKIWDNSTIIEKILKAVDQRLKKLPTEALKELGLELPEKGKRLDPIVKTRDCFDFLQNEVLNEDKLWAALKFSKTDLVELLMEEKQYTEKMAKGYIQETLGPFIEKKNAEPALREIK